MDGDMNRRSFLKYLGAGTGASVGLGALGSGLWLTSADGRFDTERRGARDLYPRPADGEVVEVSPPPFAWLPVQIRDNGTDRILSFEYCISIWNAGGNLVYRARTGTKRIHVPTEVFPSGDYTWDVTIVDSFDREVCSRGIQRFTIANEFVELPWIEPATILSSIPREHPRVIYRREDLPQIRNLIHTTRSEGWAECQQMAEEACELPTLSYPTHHLIEDTSRRSLEYVRYFLPLDNHLLRTLVYAPLAFLITEEQRYADAAKRTLLEIASWPVVDGDVTSVSKTYGDEVGLKLGRYVHLAYDWLYDALSENERQSVLHMCEQRAWQLLRRLEERDFHSTPGESHNGRIITHLTDMSVAMAGESEGATTWLDYSLKALMTVYPHWGGRDGGWAEGPTYAFQYNRYHTTAFESLKRTCGLDLWNRPFYRKLLRYILYCTSPHADFLPFGDGAEKIHFITKSPFWEPAHIFNDQYMGWWLQQVKHHTTERNHDQECLFRTAPTSLAFDDQLPVEAPRNLPQSEVFRGIGWVGMHSSLAEPERDTFLVFKSSPYGSMSHSHPDQNSFAILKGGKALAIPSGYYAPRYFFPHHKHWNHSTRANNTILVNGEGQPRHSLQASGFISAFENRPGLTYAAGDATAAYMGNLNKYLRHIVFLRPGLFIVLDELEAPSAQFQWMLHTLEEMEIHPELGRIIARRDGTKMEVNIRSTSDFIFEQTDQFDPPVNEGVPPEYQVDVPNHWHLTAQTVQRADIVRIAAFITVSGPGERADVEMFEEEGRIGTRVTFNEGVVEGWVRLVGGTTGPVVFGDAAASGNKVITGRAHDGDTVGI